MFVCLFSGVVAELQPAAADLPPLPNPGENPDLKDLLTQGMATRREKRMQMLRFARKLTRQQLKIISVYFLSFLRFSGLVSFVYLSLIKENFLVAVGYS